MADCVVRGARLAIQQRIWVKLVPADNLNYSNLLIDALESWRITVRTIPLEFIDLNNRQVRKRRICVMAIADVQP
jgi:hypothetical protein